MDNIRRFPVPGRVQGNEACFWVEDSQGKRFGYCYFLARGRLSHDGEMLSREEARRIVANIAKLPDLLR